MIYRSEEEIYREGTITQKEGKVSFLDKEKFLKTTLYNILDTLISGDTSLKKLCSWITYDLALDEGIIPSSINSLYRAIGRGEVDIPFTVPAINLRTLTFDLARAIFRSAKKINAGSFIFEIAKSEIGYTAQRPLEYTTVIMLAALKENYLHPIFIQGDHFQLKANKFKEDPQREILNIKTLIKEAVEAGFYNIDIDSSTLVDLSRPEISQQQENNYKVCAELSQYIRSLQPEGIQISIGGEIGEVGGKNSTPEELESFMEGYLREIKGEEGISKISIQTGTSHGGVVLPDGSIARVKIDFDTLNKLSKLAREKYHLAGCVQHGASTLPQEAFHNFPLNRCAEIHLATQFQNIVYEQMPLSLKEKIYNWLNENCAEERKPEMTDDQFIYKTRKKALGPFKEEIHSLPREWKEKVSASLEKEFDFLFNELKIKDTRSIVDKYIKPRPIKKEKHHFLAEEKELGELEGAD